MDVLDAIKIILLYVFHVLVQITLITQVIVSHALLVVKLAQQILYAQVAILGLLCFQMESAITILAIPVFDKFKAHVSLATQAIGLVAVIV